MFVKYQIWYNAEKDRYEVRKISQMEGSLVSFHQLEKEAQLNLDRIIANPSRLVREEKLHLEE